MGLFSDLKILYHMAVRPIRGKNHADRLDSFYGGQADSYDSFRKRLLKGRTELWNSIPISEGMSWADIGGGTGANLMNFGDNIKKLKKVYVVDLAGSLLQVADKRIQDAGWDNVQTVHTDATTWIPPEGSVDVVTFSYSLTMIPDWFAAIDQAYKILKPGGRIGVVDFYLSRKFPVEPMKKHGWLTRSFWPVWFACDNVFPSTDHIPYLMHKFEKIDLAEEKGTVPYFPLFWWKMPYYRFVGKKIQD
ncbi:MAG: class I SAM-dependent methyltransferase [Planctomycetia bacterium]|nr:class I SAM-dependent methyltransferase [Planctomycetia bacterium]